MPTFMIGEQHFNLRGMNLQSSIFKRLYFGSLDGEVSILREVTLKNN